MKRLTLNTALVFTLVLVVSSTIAMGTSSLSSETNIRVFGCSVAIPVGYDIALTSIEYEAIILVNRNLATGGSVKISKYTGREIHKNDNKKLVREQLEPLNIGSLLVFRETVRLSPEAVPVQTVRITDRKDELVLVGDATKFWEEMVNQCLSTQD